jgi:ribosomal protein S18 acetylase RimI-like enzyme
LIRYRLFRNTDPRGLADLWQATATGPAFARPLPKKAWENTVLSKTYFDRHGFIVAETESGLVGFVHAGFGPTADQSTLSTEHGIISMMLVRPEYRRQGIGTELLKRAEEYLQAAGSKTISAGESERSSPFYLDIYRGSGVAGVLDALPGASQFFQARGYQPGVRSCIWERSLEDFVPRMDRTFLALKRSTQTTEDDDPNAKTWWEACTWGRLEQTQFDLVSLPAGEFLGSTIVARLSMLSRYWGVNSVELRHVEVSPKHRRAGVATFMMAEVFRRLRESGVDSVQIQTLESNTAGVALCRKLGMQQICWGSVYRKALE